MLDSSPMTGVTGGIASLDERIPFLLSQLGAHVAGEFQRQLSARLGIHRNAMVNIVDTLESDGLVERKPHPDDGRAFAVTLTDRARGLLPELDRAARALEEAVTAGLSASERDVLRSLLQRIAGSAGLIPGVHPGLTDDAATC
jgi:DNA-binding MarR family transcriptional regulator